MGYDFDLIVIGGGAAGLVASKFAAGVGKKVALIERSKLGGECTLYGCVPSKTLIRTAKVLNQINHADEVGLDMGRALPVPGDAVLARVRQAVERVYEGHGPEVLERLGIHLVFGGPRFRDNHHIEVDGRLLSAASFIVCTGSSPLVPPISGIETIPYLTNQTLFNLERLPRSLIVLGGGPIGIEMAQAFNYLGVRVTAQNLGERTVSGTVLNAASAPVIGATVFLKNEKTKSIRSFTSLDDGHFHFAQVNKDQDYDLWAEKDGKKSAVKTVSSWDARTEFVSDLKLK